MMKVLSDCEDELTMALSDGEKKILKRYMNAQLEVKNLTEITKFVYGFKLGAQIMLEAWKRVECDES